MVLEGLISSHGADVLIQGVRIAFDRSAHTDISRIVADDVVVLECRGADEAPTQGICTDHFRSGTPTTAWIVDQVSKACFIWASETCETELYYALIFPAVVQRYFEIAAIETWDRLISRGG